MPAGQLISFVNAVPSPWNTVIKMLLAIIGGVYMIFKTFKYIPEGHEGLRLRFQVVVRRDGKPVVLRKGLHVMFPFVHNIQVVNVLDRTMPLRAVNAFASEFLVYAIRATAIFKVADIYRLSYGAEEPMPRLKAACEAAFRAALATHPPQSGTPDAEAITAMFASQVADAARSVGVEFARLEIQDVKPDSGVMVAGAIRSLGPDAAATVKALGLTTPTTNGESAQ